MDTWTIYQLNQKLEKDLLSCHSDFEKSMVKAIGGKEIRERAQELAKQRILNPTELLIAQNFGF